MDQSILLQTLNGEATSRPPFWFMRQAGRVLPSYMALKDKYSFWQMMQKPDMGAEVTLLPVHDLGVDAAILFSDILVIPYAMGMGLDFTDEGPVFEKALAYRDNPLADLNPNPEKLNYIYDVIDKIIETKPANIPLIGFCGGPLTVLMYMLEGLGRRAEFPIATDYVFKNKAVIKKLIDRMTDLTLIYVKGQIDHGIQVFQLFETHAGLIPFELYKELCFPMVKKVAELCKANNIPMIYFPKGIGTGISDVTPDYCDYLGIDWQTPITHARKLVDNSIGLQGNMDPRVLFGTEEEIIKTLESYLPFGRENQNWIFNLGHGFKPGIEFDKIKIMTEWLKSADWGR